MTLGSWGEGVAEKYLKRKGYVILERNFRCNAGEIDLIARDGDCLVFVEVKTRRCLEYGLPCEAVTRTKMRHLKRVAAYYLKGKNNDDTELRIDVVEILAQNGRTFLHHIENAEVC